MKRKHFGWQTNKRFVRLLQSNLSKTLFMNMPIDSIQLQMSAWFRGYWQNSFFDDYQKLDEDVPKISIQESKPSLQGQVEHSWSNCQTQILLDLSVSQGRRWNIVYIDEFNISSTSIKTYNWSVRGCQDYWFADKKSSKLNCIIAVSADGPVDIFIQEDSI